MASRSGVSSSTEGRETADGQQSNQARREEEARQDEGPARQVQGQGEGGDGAHVGGPEKTPARPEGGREALQELAQAGVAGCLPSTWCSTTCMATSARVL